MKIVGGLLAVLFVSQAVQLGVMSKLSNTVARNNANMSQQSLAMSQFAYQQSQAAAVSSVSASVQNLMNDVTFEQYMQERFPKDYQARIDRINSNIMRVLDDHGVEMEQRNIFNRIGCWISGGVYQNLGNGTSICITFDITTINGGNPVTEIDTQRSSENMTVGHQGLYSWNPEYETELPDLLQDIYDVFEQEGIDMDGEPPSWLRRFFCELFGGDWSEVDYNYEGFDVHAEACFHGFEDS